MATHFNHGACARARRGVTLVELLVVVAIIGALVALLLPAIQATRESARRGQCQHHLRQLTLALALHAARDGAYPVGCAGRWRDLSQTPVLPQRFIAWNVELLPFLEEQPLWDRFDFSRPSYHADNLPVAETVVAVFLCPSTVEPELRNTSGLWRGAAFTDFGGVYGVEGTSRKVPPEESAEHDGGSQRQVLRDDSLGVLLYDEPVGLKQITDGLSKTAAIAETTLRRQTEAEWVNGNNLFAQEESNPIGGVGEGLGREIGSPHPGGASLAFCDGHVRFVAEATDQAVLNALLTKAGGD